MAQLIDKAALMTEIERRRNDYINSFMTEQVYMLNNVLDFLDTLEVKEVDLDEEYKVFVEKDPVYNQLVNGIVGKAIAKHFFELGLKVRKGEKVWR